ncbi:MAG: OsmC family peroxiredoxin [Gemmatimonadetes bacterium]|nr:OsmC family peroxiredoxin [Gemmatimonadota bacterium]
MKRKAQAVWRGAGKDGTGTITTGSGAMKEQPYSALTRFEDESGRAGTNPDELIAAAHASCFSMALAYQLSGAGHAPQELSTEAVLDMKKDDSGWSITGSHLTVKGTVPGISKEQFAEFAGKAKEGCPVSRALSVPITMDAHLD